MKSKTIVNGLFGSNIDRTMKTRIVRKGNRFYVQRLFFGFWWMSVLTDIDGDSASFEKLEWAQEARDRFYGPQTKPHFEVIEYSE